MYQDTTLGSKLLVQHRNVIIVLSLEHITSDRIPKLMLRGKLFNGKVCTVIPACIGQTFLSERDLFRLLVHEKYVTMETRAFWWPSANVRGENFSFRHVVTRNVSYQPVMPLAELWLFTAGSIGIWNENVKTLSKSKRYTCLRWVTYQSYKEYTRHLPLRSR